MKRSFRNCVCVIDNYLTEIATLLFTFRKLGRFIKSKEKNSCLRTERTFLNAKIVFVNFKALRNWKIFVKAHQNDFGNFDDYNKMVNCNYNC
jgi:hypothetical protein